MNAIVNTDLYWARTGIKLINKGERVEATPFVSHPGAEPSKSYFVVKRVSAPAVVAHRKHLDFPVETEEDK